VETYFTFIGTVFSLILILKLPVIYFLGKKWNQFELGVIYKEEKPTWIKYLLVFDIVIIAYTWYQYTIDQNKRNLIISLIVSLTMIKVSTVMFNYKNFRNFAENATVVKKEKLLLLNLFTFLLGIFLLYVTFNGNL
jgi:hypothetical protein